MNKTKPCDRAFTVRIFGKDHGGQTDRACAPPQGAADPRAVWLLRTAIAASARVLIAAHWLPSVKWLQTTRLDRGIVPHCMGMTPTGGSHGNPHRPEKIHSDAWRCCCDVAV